MAERRLEETSQATDEGKFIFEENPTTTVHGSCLKLSSQTQECKCRQTECSYIWTESHKRTSEGCYTKANRGKGFFPFDQGLIWLVQLLVLKSEISSNPSVSPPWPAAQEPPLCAAFEGDSYVHDIHRHGAGRRDQHGFPFYLVLSREQPLDRQVDQDPSHDPDGEHGKQGSQNLCGGGGREKSRRICKYRELPGLEPSHWSAFHSSPDPPSWRCQALNLGSSG